MEHWVVRARSQVRGQERGAREVWPHAESLRVAYLVPPPTVFMLYLHIPFCKQACSYCNFHFSTSMKTRPAVLEGIRRELRLLREYLPPGPVPSVYFGGGTPSLLTGEELDSIFTVLYDVGYLGAGAPAEITLEANPDDLTDDAIALLAASPVNRLSIGIQSFFEADLRFMNRAHSATEALVAVDKVAAAGFTDLSIDLIYGGQTTSDVMWAENLRRATALGVNHISAYALTVEPKTALGRRVATGQVVDTDEEKFARHFHLLVDHLTAADYAHYEISNFCRPGHVSRHNSGYWSGRAYLGVGPGAHSFDGQRTRRWNVSNNARYAKVWAEINDPADFAAAAGLLYEEEQLSLADRYNEYIMTGLRRSEGVNADRLAEEFGLDLAGHFVRSQAQNLAAGYFQSAPGPVYRLTRAGLMRADGIAADGFWVADDPERA